MLEELPWADLALNIMAILLSFLAVYYMVQIYKRLSKTDIIQTKGWQWLFVASLGILLFNLTSLYLLFNVGDVAAIFKRFDLNIGNFEFLRSVDVRVLETFNILGRTIIVFAMTIGAYLLYAPMQEGQTYSFVPVKPALEKKSARKRRYFIEKGSSYLVKEEKPEQSSQIFVDFVTHGVHGLYITRRFPDKVKEEYNLRKTPIIWLCREESDYKQVINPRDLVGLSHTIREFVKKTKDGIILLDGLEYLASQNSFPEVLRTMQSLDDTLASSNSRLLIPYDDSAFDEKQLHLLNREIPDLDQYLNEEKG
ncbi:DUF835 domain-containing protein [Candidatus Altiarchaeota archaeon]